MLELQSRQFRSLLLGAILVTACATTEISSTWKDPSYEERPARIMVIGVARNPVNRRLFEDEFVRQLKSRGADAIASHTVLPDRQEGDQIAIAAKVNELKADTVLITRLVNKKAVQSYVPGTVYYPPPIYSTWPDYYGFGYRSLYSPGYITESQYAILETNLYEAQHNKLVWSASSETLLNDSDENLIKSFIGTMVKTMANSGLLNK